MTALVLTRAAIEAVTAHAVADFPAEAVGLLAGDRDGRVVGTRPLPNEAGRLATVRYRVGAAPLALAQAELTAAGRTVVGVYHSHPRRPAALSRVDRRSAAAGAVQLVVGVPARQGPIELRAWAPREDPEDELAIEVVP